ncbi:MAG: M48 family peptidase, partial [Terracidiphilus sp.]
MRIVRTVVLVLFAIALSAVPALCLQASPAPSATTEAQTTAPQQAYHLPPEKLAKAIALSRIRDIEHFVDAFWGFVVLWLLLATRAAAGLEAWAVGVFKKRWLQGLLFFAALIVVLTLTELPLDMYMHTVSRQYDISVQG